jgi:2-polyprenyl-3-methyl-5-hydroxy-6-metoxy-1,4-benzoquinol methylase
MKSGGWTPTNLIQNEGPDGPRGNPDARAISSVPTGNTYDKYGSTNPVVRRLMAGFQHTLAELFERAAREGGIESLLDVGCGEGILTFQWAEQLGSRPVVGVDLPDPKLESEWRTRQRPNLRFMAARAEKLPFDEGEFDLVTAIEALEHIPDPERTVAEMVRVARAHVLVSVPREPLWRALNVARGAYVRELGNTPGHVNHWSGRSLQRMLARHGEVVQARSPFPWTMVLLRVS